MSQKWDTCSYELKEAKPSRNFLLSGFKAMQKKRSSIETIPTDLINDADFLIIASPIWAGNGNPIINSFVDQADLDKKPVYLCTVQADPQCKTAPKVFGYLSKVIGSKGGMVKGSKAFHGASPGKTASRSDLEKQLAQWNIIQS
ncbi:flavodoxin family protein [Spirochaeta cellobiosiphila]|uniref:flavodoxin family protein n=1 Tax=Spirochaeta cellobiosiphila TaxID=504483 RepID=UPI00048D76F7|nr:hypothetical protein [Spirochaeta cellobiosiphila]